MKQPITEPTALALGNFDGLHRGHALVLEGAKQAAQTNGLVPGVLLFDEHPKQVLCGQTPPLLMTGEEKQKRLTDAGFRVFSRAQLVLHAAGGAAVLGDERLRACSGEHDLVHRA